MTDPATFTGATGAPNLAVDVQATGVLGEFSVDVDEVGGPALLGWGETGWLNVVCDVTRLVMRRGATRSQGVLARAEAASITLEILDTDRRFDPLLNADAVHAGTPLRVRAWGEIPGVAWSAEQRRNSVRNPHAAVDLAGWVVVTGTGGAATVTRRATAAPDGGAAWSATWTTVGTGAIGATIGADAPIAVVPGEIWTFSAYVWADRSRGVRMAYTWLSASSVATTVAGTIVTVPAGTWTRVEQTVTIPVGAVSVYLRPVTSAAAVIGDRLDVTMATAELAPGPAGAYFDGDTADEPLAAGALAYEWTGTPYASPSIEVAGVATAEPWDEVIVTGEVDDVPVTYTRTGAPRVTLQATDVIGAELVPWASPGRPAPGVGAGDDLKQRTERVLDELNVAAAFSPETALATEFTATHPPTTLERGWQAIADAADAELGRVWVTRHGEIAVRGRTLEPWGTLRGTLSDWHGEAPVEPHACYDDLAATLGTELLTNRAIGARRIPEGVEETPAVVQRDDTFSQATYRLRATENRSLELETDAQVAAWAEQLLAVSSVPELRVDSVSVAPWGAGPEAWRAVCSTDLGDRWLLRHHPEIGPSIAVAVGVLGIELEVTPEGWSIRWATESALAPGDNPSSSFAVDVSELSGADELATFGGPVPAPEPVA